MTFIRGPLNRKTLNIGKRELIIQDIINAGFYKYRESSLFSDIELLRYVSSAGKEEWFDFLIKDGDFFDAKGKIKNEFSGQFDECIIFAVNHGHAGIARKLFGLGAKVRYYLSDCLLLAIRNNQHDMAELCYEMGAKIRVKYKLKECLKRADDRMVGIIESHGDSIKLSLIGDPQSCISELLERRKNRKTTGRRK